MSRPLLTRMQLLNLGSTGARAGAALAMQKLVAMRYGPAGVLELGQFALVQSLCYALLTDGLNRAMMVEAGLMPDLPRRLAVLAKAGAAAALLMACVTVLAWWAMPHLLPGAAPLALPLALAIGAGGWAWWVASTLQFEDFPGLVLGLSILQGLVMVAGVYWPEENLPAFLPTASGPTGSLPTRLLLVAIGQAGLSLFSGGYYQWRLRRSAGSALREPHALYRRVWAYGGLSLAILLAGRGTDVAVRAYAMHLGYWQELGLYQAAVRLGDLIFVPMTPLFATVFFARASQMPVSSLGLALRPQLRLAALGTLAIGFLVLIGPKVLEALNRKDFAEAAPYYYRQALGDVIRLLALPVSIALLAAGRVRTTALLEGMSLLAYLASIALLVPLEGSLGLSTAQTLRYAIYGAALTWAARDLLFLRKEPALPNLAPHADETHS